MADGSTPIPSRSRGVSNPLGATVPGSSYASGTPVPTGREQNTIKSLEAHIRRLQHDKNELETKFKESEKNAIELKNGNAELQRQRIKDHDESKKDRRQAEKSKTIEKEKSAVEEKYRICNAKLEETMKTNQELMNRMEAHTQEWMTSLKAKDLEVDRVNKAIEKLEDKLRMERHKVDRLEAESKEKDSTEYSYLQKVQRLESEIQAREDKVDVLERACAQREADYEQLSKENSELEGRYKNLSDAIERGQSELGERDEAVSVLETKIVALQNEIEKGERTVAHKDEAMKKIRGLNAELTEKSRQHHDEVRRKEAAMGDMKQEVTCLKSEITVLQARLDDARNAEENAKTNAKRALSEAQNAKNTTKTSETSIKGLHDDIQRLKTQMADQELSHKLEMDRKDLAVQEVRDDLGDVTKIVSVRDATIETLQDQLKGLQTGKSEALTTSRKLQEDYDAAKETIIGLERQIANLTQNLESETSTVADLRGELEALQQQHNVLSSELDVTVSKLADAETNANAASDDGAEKSKRIVSMEGELLVSKKEIAALRSENETLTERVKSEITKISSLTTDALGKASDLVDARKEAHDLEDHLTAKQKELIAAQEAHATLQREFDEKEAQLEGKVRGLESVLRETQEELQGTITNAKDAVAELEEKLEEANHSATKLQADFGKDANAKEAQFLVQQAAAEKALGKVEAERDELAQQLHKMRQAHDAKYREVQGLTATINRLEDSMKREDTHRQARVVQLERLLEESSERSSRDRATAQQEVDRLVSQLDEAIDSKEKAKTELISLNSKFDVTQRHHDKYKEAYEIVKDKLKRSCEAREEETRRAKQAIANKNENIDEFEAALLALHARYEKVVARAMKLKNFGKVDALPDEVTRMTTRLGERGDSAVSCRDSTASNILNGANVNVVRGSQFAALGKRKRLEGDDGHHEFAQD